jgi:hypothetical protein
MSKQAKHVEKATGEAKGFWASLVRLFGEA